MMIWKMSDCLAIRARLAAEDFDLDAFEPEICERISRATGRPFAFGAVSGNEVLS